MFQSSVPSFSTLVTNRFSTLDIEGTDIAIDGSTLPFFRCSGVITDLPEQHSQASDSASDSDR